MAHKKWMIVALLMFFTSVASVQAETVFYVAPEAQGDGSGSKAAQAAAFDDAALWQKVQPALEQGAVEIVFLDGTYLMNPTLRLDSIGHVEHPLTLRGQSEQGVIVRDHPKDQNERNPLFRVGNSRNITFRNFTFTGPERVGMGIQIADCRKIRVENCRWIDFTGTYYSGISITGAGTSDVIVRNCHFERLGWDGHAHMIYTSYQPTLMKFIDNTFIDCAGDFVRFRDGADFGVVYNCEFRSTGTYKNSNPPMVSMPLFNDNDPEAGETRANYEYFGSDFLIANNRFIYEQEPEEESTHWPVLFHHSGFDPPGRRHLLAPEEAAALEDASGDLEERRALVRRTLGVDMNRVRLFNNEYQNIDARVAYRATPNYGAKDRGWSGSIALTDLVNTTPVDLNTEQAVYFFESGMQADTLD